MEDFKYFKLNSGLEYILLVSNEDPYFLYGEIYDILNSDKKTILLDMFYRNGYSFNRFIELIFVKNGKTITRVVNPREVPEDVKINTNAYFNENYNLIEKSTLNKSTKEFIRWSYL